MIQEMGRPFPVDRGFPRYLRAHYFTHVAPIVELWLLAVKEVLPKYELYVQFPTAIETTHDQRPSAR